MTQIFDTVCLNLNTYTEEIYYNIWHCNKYIENCFSCNNIALFCTNYMNYSELHHNTQETVGSNKMLEGNKKHQAIKQKE